MLIFFKIKFNIDELGRWLSSILRSDFKAKCRNQKHKYSGNKAKGGEENKDVSITKIGL